MCIRDRGRSYPFIGNDALKLYEAAPPVHAIPVGDRVQRIEELCEVDAPFPPASRDAVEVQPVEHPDRAGIERELRQIHRHARTPATPQRRPVLDVISRLEHAPAEGAAAGETVDPADGVAV